ncbi:GAF and ANTAR domain-containing protein [Actinomycetospora sp.]|jgi:GAF domain-containing protein|uniref:GAF and ANTAR domain-containing protein n=1 Tax=Actinomycetospora sp. TaxID=1872135 RepID=UPI002F415A36
MDPHRTPHAIAEAVLGLTDARAGDDDPVVPARELVRASTRLLPVDAARVFLVDGRAELVSVAATPGVEHADQPRGLALEGPSHECVRAGRAVSCPDLAHGPVPWADDARTGRDDGFRSMHAVPLAHQAEIVGCLNLLRRRPGALADADQLVAEQLAAAATIGILNRRALLHLLTVNAQLQQALHSRIAIEQAKGRLAERHSVTMEEAFTRMRQYARRTRTPLHRIAHDVVERQFDPPETSSRGRCTTYR